MTTDEKASDLAAALDELQRALAQKYEAMSPAVACEGNRLAGVARARVLAAHEAAVEEERENLRGWIGGNARAVKSSVQQIHDLLDAADVEPNRDYMVRIALLSRQRDEEQARARKAETRVHVLAGHLGMETHDESLAAAAKALRGHAEKAEAMVREYGALIAKREVRHRVELDDCNQQIATLLADKERLDSGCIRMSINAADRRQSILYLDADLRACIDDARARVTNTAGGADA